MFGRLVTNWKAVVAGTALALTLILAQARPAQTLLRLRHPSVIVGAVLDDFEGGGGKFGGGGAGGSW